MRTLYLKCSFGVSGYMLMGSLIDILYDKSIFLREMEKLCLPQKYGYELSIYKTKAGEKDAVKTDIISKFDQDITKDDIFTFINQSSLSDTVKYKIIKILSNFLMADENAFLSKDRSNFDIMIKTAGIAILLDIIKPGIVMCSPINKNIQDKDPVSEKIISLFRIPYKYSDISGHISPAGAAILSGIVNEYGPMPRMKILKAGYGADRGNTENVLMAALGETDDTLSEMAFSFEADLVFSDRLYTV